MKIILSLFLVLIALSVQAQTQQNYYLPDPLFQQGFAEVKVEPEVLLMSLTVETLHEESQTSLQQNADIIENVVDEITSKNDIDGEEEISTSNFQIFPQFDFVLNKDTERYEKVFKGTKVINTLQIRTKSLDAAGDIIDAAIKNGVTNISGVNFDITNETRKDREEKLIELAIQNARKKAEIGLAELNYKIVGVKSLSINPTFSNSYKDNQFSRPSFAEDSASGGGASTQVFSSDISVSVNVNVGFLIQADIDFQ